MSVLHQLPELTDIETLGLFPAEVEASSELILGQITLFPGQTLPIHCHQQSETLFLLTGSARVQRGRAITEIEAPAAVYFAAGDFHRITTLGQDTSSLLLCYQRVSGGGALQTTLADPALDAGAWPNPNTISGQDLLFRWAVAEDYEPAVGVEPSKGMKLTVRYLLDPQRGAADVAAGTCRFEPNVHFTVHRHAPPEIYYVLDGRGVVYVADQTLAVSASSAIYIPGGVAHGIDTYDHALQFFWLYGLQRTGPDWRWEPVEDVYTIPRGGADDRR